MLPRATFRVRHRSPIGLAIAALLVAAAVAWSVNCWASPTAPRLLLLASLLPALFVTYAFYLSVGHAAEVDLVVEAIPNDRDVRVTLRRRWSFLPWTKPLVFRAADAPRLVTQWDTGRTSGKSGPSRDYEIARLVLKVGEAEIRLPAMRGGRDGSKPVVVIEHAAVVREAMARYADEVQALRKAVKGTKRDRRAITNDDPSSRLLVASIEGGFDTRVSAALGVAVVVAALFGLTAYLVPHSNLALGLGGLAVPVLGCSIALAATASSYGYTHTFRRKGADHTSITRVRDLFLFGPRDRR